MRVLFLISRDIRHPANTGGDIGLWERAMYLAHHGHDVTVVASNFAGGLSRETIDGIKVFRSGGLLSQWWRTFFYYMTKARGRYDVVVVEGFGGSRIPRFTPLYVNEPIVTEWHQIHAELFKVQYPAILVPALNLLERVTAFVHRNTIVMARTKEWQEAFPSIGFKAANIRVVPACIPESWFVDRPHKVAEPRIVWLGKFRRYKCPDHAIRAMKAVVQKVPNAKLVLAGFHDDRIYEGELVNLADELGLQAAVEFQFGLTDEEKQSLLDSCRALVMTSAVEGFGIVVLEANARGVPVIASSGVPEGAVQDAINGQRYQFGDVDGLAKHIVRICSDDRLHAQLSDNALAFAHKFGWREVCRQYENVLVEAIARGLSHRTAVTEVER